MIVQIQPAYAVGEHVRKFGKNSDVDASTGPDEDIIATGGTQYLPSAVVAGSSINIASSSANDTSAGTGARTLTIEGLDANYLIQSETVTLSGATPVNPVNNYIRIYQAFVETAGTGETNAGNITIADGSGTFATIAAGKGQTQQAAYTIPANYTVGYLLGFDAEVDSKTAATAEVTLKVRSFGGAWLTTEEFAVSNAAPYIFNYVMPIAYPAKTDLKLTVIDASADNLPITGGFHIYLR